MTYTEQHDLANDAAFKDRCLVAIAIVARTAFFEDITTPNHLNRVAFARTLIMDSDRWVNAVALGVATYPGIMASATDAEIQNAVNAMFNLYAGE